MNTQITPSTVQAVQPDTYEPASPLPHSTPTLDESVEEICRILARVLMRVTSDGQESPEALHG